MKTAKIGNQEKIDRGAKRSQAGTLTPPRFEAKLRGRLDTIL